MGVARHLQALRSGRVSFEECVEFYVVLLNTAINMQISHIGVDLFKVPHGKNNNN